MKRLRSLLVKSPKLMKALKKFHIMGGRSPWKLRNCKLYLLRFTYNLMRLRQLKPKRQKSVSYKPLYLYVEYRHVDINLEYARRRYFLNQKRKERRSPKVWSFRRLIQHLTNLCWNNFKANKCLKVYSPSQVIVTGCQRWESQRNTKHCKTLRESP